MDVYTRDYTNRTRFSAIKRMWAHVIQRMPRLERKQCGAFAVDRRGDGYDYITPTPVGALPMGKRRAR